MVSVLANRVCDPQVGIGAKPAVCASFCQQWHGACAESFFQYDGRSGLLRPCGLHQQAGICAQLASIVSDGLSLCQAAKLHVAEPVGASARAHDHETDLSTSRQTLTHELCFDGSVPETLPVCKRESSPARAKHKKPGTELGSMPEQYVALWVLMAGAALAVVACRQHIVGRVQRIRFRHTPVSRPPTGHFRGKPRFAK